MIRGPRPGARVEAVARALPRWLLRPLLVAGLMGVLGGCAAAPFSATPAAALAAPTPVEHAIIAASSMTLPDAVVFVAVQPVDAALVEWPPYEPACCEAATTDATYRGDRFAQGAAVPSDSNGGAVTPATPQVASVPPPEPAAPVAPPIVVTQEPTPEEREFSALLVDLQRYGALSADDLRRELTAQSQALNRGRTDVLRVRVAVLQTLTRQGTADDQRALALFDTVAKGNPGPSAVKQLAAVLAAQVAERVRAVREEQARSEAALQKLEALRAMERSLLRDRLRSGGGGGAGSGGGN